jgi:hypothetical protein
MSVLHVSRLARISRRRATGHHGRQHQGVGRHFGQITVARQIGGNAGFLRERQHGGMPRQEDQVVETFVADHRRSTRQRDAFLLGTVQLEQQHSPALHIVIERTGCTGQMLVVSCFPLRPGNHNNPIVGQPGSLHLRRLLHVKRQSQSLTRLLEIRAAVP